MSSILSFAVIQVFVYFLLRIGMTRLSLHSSQNTTSKTGNPMELLSLQCIPQAVDIINMVSLQVYIYIQILGWIFYLVCYLFWLVLSLCVCPCVCLHLEICFCLSLCVSTAGLDIGPLTDSSPVAPPSQGGRRTPRSLPEEPLDGILSPELDKMVTDGQ